MERLFWQSNRNRNCLIDGVSSESLTKGETFVSHSRIKLPPLSRGVQGTQDCTVEAVRTNAI